MRVQYHILIFLLALGTGSAANPTLRSILAFQERITLKKFAEKPRDFTKDILFKDKQMAFAGLSRYAMSPITARSPSVVSIEHAKPPQKYLKPLGEMRGDVFDLHLTRLNTYMHSLKSPHRSFDLIRFFRHIPGVSANNVQAYQLAEYVALHVTKDQEKICLKKNPCPRDWSNLSEAYYQLSQAHFHLTQTSSRYEQLREEFLLRSLAFAPTMEEISALKSQPKQYITATTNKHIQRLLELMHQKKYRGKQLKNVLSHIKETYGYEKEEGRALQRRTTTQNIRKKKRFEQYNKSRRRNQKAS